MVSQLPYMLSIGRGNRDPVCLLDGATAPAAVLRATQPTSNPGHQWFANAAAGSSAEMSSCNGKSNFRLSNLHIMSGPFDMSHMTLPLIIAHGSHSSAISEVLLVATKSPELRQLLINERHQQLKQGCIAAGRQVQTI